MPKIITPLALQHILESHRAWLQNTEGQRATLTRARLTGADLTRADLTWANLTGADLTGADLTWANLTGADLTGADLTRATLTGARLTRADLTWADLTGADLTRADLTRADLTGARLTNTRGLPLAPSVPNLDAQILQRITTDPNSFGMLMYHDHCGTRHCRAGWAIVLAGAEGAALENHYGPNVAGALIYAASYPGYPVPDFYATNQDAIKDMQQRAADAQDLEIPHA